MENFSKSYLLNVLKWLALLLISIGVGCTGRVFLSLALRDAFDSLGPVWGLDFSSLAFFSMLAGPMADCVFAQRPHKAFIPWLSINIGFLVVLALTPYETVVEAGLYIALYIGLVVVSCVMMLIVNASIKNLALRYAEALDGGGEG